MIDTKDSKRPFEAQGCVFKGDCLKYGTQDCCNPCWRQREFFFLLDNSNLPEKHKTDIKLIPAKEDLAAFEYLDHIRNNIEGFVNSGNSLLITGATGTGKTTWATKLLRRYLMERSIGNGYEPRALFVNLTWFVTQARHNIGNPNPYFNGLRESMYDIELLVLDDIGNTKLDSSFIHDEIFAIINCRADSKLSSIYTSNLSEQELVENLGDRLAARIINMSENVAIKNRTDMRSGGEDKSFSYNNFLNKGPVQK